MHQNKGQLVSQHLENISRTALEKYQHILKEYVKGRHGVYALYSKDRLEENWKKIVPVLFIFSNCVQRETLGAHLYS